MPMITLTIMRTIMPTMTILCLFIRAMLSICLLVCSYDYMLIIIRIYDNYAYDDAGLLSYAMYYYVYDYAYYVAS